MSQSENKIIYLSIIYLIMYCTYQVTKPHAYVWHILACIASTMSPSHMPMRGTCCYVLHLTSDRSTYLYVTHVATYCIYQVIEPHAYVWHMLLRIASTKWPSHIPMCGTSCHVLHLPSDRATCLYVTHLAMYSIY